MRSMAVLGAGPRTGLERPGGTIEISPKHRFNRPSGTETTISFAVYPAIKLLGYYQPSLRDGAMRTEPRCSRRVNSQPSEGKNTARRGGQARRLNIPLAARHDHLLYPVLRAFLTFRRMLRENGEWQIGDSPTSHVLFATAASPFLLREHWQSQWHPHEHDNTKRMRAQSDCHELDSRQTGASNSKYSTTLDGSGTGRPSSLIPSRCKAMASRKRCSVSSTVAPVATHPGRVRDVRTVVGRRFFNDDRVSFHGYSPLEARLL